MSKARTSAISKTAGAPTPPAAPAASRAAGATGAKEPDYALPSAAEIGAHLAEPETEEEGDSELPEKEIGRDITPRPPPEPADEAEEDGAAAGDPAAEEPDPAAADSAAEDESDPAEAPEAEEAEAAEPAAAEGETSPDDQQSEPKPTERYQKRIDELTAARQRAETEAAQLREQLAAAKATAPADPLNPFALVDTEQELDAAVDREERFMEWVLANEANPDGADLPDGKGGTVHFEPEQLRQMKVTTYRVLRTAEKRREFIRQKAAREQETAAVYPWLRSVKDGLGAEVQQVVEARPYLRAAPDYRTFAADAVVGARLRQAGLRLDESGLAALAKGRPALRPAARPAPPVGVAGAAALAAAARPAAPVVRRTAPSPARPGTLPPRLNGREAAARQAARAVAQGDGSLGTIEQAIAAKLRF